MGRGVKAKKKRHTDRTAKYLLSEKQIDRLKNELSTQLLKDAYVLFITAARDCLNITLDDVDKLTMTFMRYSWYDEKNLVKIKEMAKYLEEEFSDNDFKVKFTGF